jgi:hypothetical protein
MTQIVVTKHAQERMALRRISPLALQSTCLRPTATEERGGCTSLIKKFSNFAHPLVAVTAEDGDKLIVITAYWKGFKTAEELLAA